AGFTLNLYRSVGSLSDLELELRDNENNLVPITAVSPVGNSNAVFAIKADISESNAPFRLTNNSIFWRIVSELGPGHMSEGIGFPARANLETIDENPQRFYACVYDLNKGYAPLEGLTAVEFSLEDESGNAVGFNFDDEELRNLEPEYAHEYLFSPKAGVFSGTYRLTFTKPGYQTVTITFSIEKVLNAVTITGEPEVGKQLVAALTPPEAQYGADYLWQRADAAEGEYVDIEENGEGYCYMLAAEDEGKFIRVIASGTGRYSESEPVISKPTVEIAPDTTAPVLSNPQAFEITDRSAILSFNSSEAGHFYYLVYREDPGKDFPNKEPEEVKSPDSTGGTADGGEGERGFAGGWTIRLGTVVELEAETVYKAYIVVEDAAGNISEVATIEFTTLPQPEEEEPGDVVDKNPLINAILQARQSYNNDEFLYTLESWEAFQAALTDAESVRDKGNATQSEIDEILEALEAAIEGLEKI
ncbi:MAG: hypothetical protein GX295_11170, partial [Syntrophomonadaceae bacterium]|nr:hypothetical protein [Syntrophomonadaceae bacterium]